MQKARLWRKSWISLVAVLIFVKVLLFYIYSAQAIRLPLLFGTIAWLAFLMLSFRVLFGGKYFLLYCIVSCILFVDILYYQYFGFLPSVKELVHVRHIGKVRSSILYVLNPLSLLLLVDLIPVGLFLRRQLYRRKEETDGLIRRFPASAWLFTVVLLLALMLPFVSEPLQQTFVFNRYGVFAYHVYDLAGVVTGTALSLKTEEIPHEGYINVVAEKGRYFGIARERNVIVIQLESFQDILINFFYNNQEVTPNLNRLANYDSIYFDDFYQQVGAGNTSDAEFVTHNSMHCLGRVSVYETHSQNSFYSLPAILQVAGFNTVAFHGNDGRFWNREEVYPALGFDDYFSIEDFERDEIIGLGLSDLSLFRQTAAIIDQLTGPVFAFVVTLTSHNPYEIPVEYHGIDLLPEHENTLFGNYLRAVNYTDRALGEFLQDLKGRGLYDSSMIVLYGDHAGLYPFNRENREIMSSLLGEEYKFAHAMNIPLIFHIPGSKLRDVNSTPGGQIDFFPTILNLLGIVERKGILFGRDLCNASSGFVALTHYVPEGSFIDDSRIFIMSPDGILNNSEAIDRSTGQPIPPFSCLDGYKNAIEQIEASKYFIVNDSISKLLEDITPQNRKPQGF